MNVRKLKFISSTRLHRGIEETLDWMVRAGLVLGLMFGSTTAIGQDRPPGIEAGPIAIDVSEQNNAIRIVIQTYSLRFHKLGEPAPEGEVFLILRGTLINKSSSLQTAVPDVQRAFTLQLAGNRMIGLHPLSEDTADPFWGPITLEAGEKLPIEMVFLVPAMPLKQAGLFHLSSAGSIHVAVVGQLIGSSSSRVAQPGPEGPSDEVRIAEGTDMTSLPDAGTDDPVSVNESGEGRELHARTEATAEEPWEGNLTLSDAPYARFAYVANFDDHTISAYTVDTETGGLRHNGYVFSVVGRGPFWATADPKGKFLFVANIENKIISVYTIHAQTGALEFAGATEVEEYPSAIAIDPAGKFLYAVNEQSDKLSLYVVNQRSGALRLARELCTGRAPSSLTIDPLGRFLYAMNRVGKTVSLYPIDPRFGSITTPAGGCGEQFDAGESPTSLAVNPEGTFAYVADTKSNEVLVYAVDQTSGKLEPIGEPVPVGLGPVWVTIHPSGRLAYVANLISNDISIFRILRNGGLDHRATIDAEAGPQSIVLDPRGSYAYVTNRDANHVSVYEIDPQSGLLDYASSVTARSWPRSLALHTGTEPIEQVPKFVYVWGYDTRVAAFELDVESGRHREILGSPFAVNAGHVAVDRTGTFAYRLQHDAISVYALDRHTGEVIFKERTPISEADFTGVSLTLDPSGRWAYVTDHQFDPRRDDVSDIFVFAIDPNTGSAKAPGGPTLSLRTSNLSPVLVDPAGKFAFVSLRQEGRPNLLAIHTVDAASGSLSEEPSAMGPRGYRVCGFHPSGRYAYAVKSPDIISVFRIAAETGKLHNVQTLKGGQYPWCLAMHPGGEFAYSVDSKRNAIVVYNIDADTGKLASEVARIRTKPYPVEVAFDPTGKFAFVFHNEAKELSVYKVDRATGTLTNIIPGLAPGFEPDTITFRLGAKQDYE